MLSTLEPRYQPPNRTRLSEELIPALYESIKSKLYAELQSSEAVSLTCDGWTSRATQSFLTVTCHFVNKNWELSSKILQTDHFEGSHTGQKIGFELKSVMTDWGISEKVGVITVDNASNMTVAVEVSGVDLKLGCFAHTLNLASNKALNIPSLDKILGKVRSVVTYFHKSNISTEILKEKQVALQMPKHKLIIDCKTRWNSTYQMLQRFLEQRPAILATLLDDRVKRADKTKVVSGLSDSDIQICEDFVSNMDVMLTATLVLCEEKSPTAGLVLPLLYKLTEHFKPKATDSTFVKSLKNAVGSDLITRYTDPNLRYFLEEASALDPRTKNKACVDEETWDRIEDKMTVLDVTGVGITVKSEKTESGEIPHTSSAVVESTPLPALPVLDEDINADEKVIL